jgi:hypothetical protein
VADGLVIATDVQVAGQGVGVDAGVVGQHAGDLGHRWVEAGHACVDLHPVAGGEDYRLADVRLFEHGAQQRRCVRRRHRDAVQQIGRGGTVRDADDQRTHAGWAVEVIA